MKIQHFYVNLTETAILLSGTSTINYFKHRDTTRRNYQSDITGILTFSFPASFPFLLLYLLPILLWVLVWLCCWWRGEKLSISAVIWSVSLGSGTAGEQTQWSMSSHWEYKPICNIHTSTQPQTGSSSRTSSSSSSLFLPPPPPWCHPSQSEAAWC